MNASNTADCLASAAVFVVAIIGSALEYKARTPLERRKSLVFFTPLWLFLVIGAICGLASGNPFPAAVIALFLTVALCAVGSIVYVAGFLLYGLMMAMIDANREEKLKSG